MVSLPFELESQRISKPGRVDVARFRLARNVSRPGSIWIISDSKFNDVSASNLSSSFVLNSLVTQSDCQAREQPKVIRTSLVEILSRARLMWILWHGHPNRRVGHFELHPGRFNIEPEN